jgi:hypothetical protein
VTRARHARCAHSAAIDHLQKRSARALSSASTRKPNQNLFATPPRPRPSSAVYPQGSREACQSRSRNRKPRLSRQFRSEVAESLFTRLEHFRSRSTVRIARRDAGLRSHVVAESRWIVAISRPSGSAGVGLEASSFRLAASSPI